MIICSCKLFDRIFDSIEKLNEDIEISIYHYPFDDESKTDPWYQLYAKKVNSKYKFYGKIYIPYETTLQDIFNAITVTCFRLIGIKHLDSNDIKQIIASDSLIEMDYADKKKDFLILKNAEMIPDYINKKIDEYEKSHKLEEKFTSFYTKWVADNENKMFDL